MERKNVESKYVYNGSRLRVREDRYEAGGKKRIYEIVERSNSVVIFPITPTGKTILLNHFRYPTQQYSVEVTMGGIDEGETSIQAAERELYEETSLRARNLEHIGSFNPVPGLTPQEVDVYIARVDDMQLDQASLILNDDDIEKLTPVGLSEIFHKVRRGEITDGFTLGSLLLLKLYLEYQTK